MIDPADRPALPGTAVYAHDGAHRGTAAGVSPDPGGGWFDDPTPDPPLTTPSTTPDAPVTDAASGTVEVTRSEEQLRLTTQSVPVGGMRVRKRIVTEEQTAPCRCVAKSSSLSRSLSPRPTPMTSPMTKHSAPSRAWSWCCTPSGRW